MNEMSWTPIGPPQPSPVPPPMPVAFSGKRRDFFDLVKRGAALVMRKARCPVLPAAITGAYERWPEREKWPRLSGPPVRVKYGKVIKDAGIRVE